MQMKANFAKFFEKKIWLISGYTVGRSPHGLLQIKKDRISAWMISKLWIEIWWLLLTVSGIKKSRVKIEESVLFQVHWKKNMFVTLFWNWHSLKSFYLLGKNCHVLLDIRFSAIFDRFREGFLIWRIVGNSWIFWSDVDARSSRPVLSCNWQI